MAVLLKNYVGTSSRDGGVTIKEYMVAESVPFGMILAIVGGFLDAYTYIGRGGVFCNSQTGNIVLLAVYAVKGEWSRALVHIPSIIAFILGVFTAEFIKRHLSKIVRADWTYIVLLSEIAVMIIIGFIPTSVSNILTTVVVSFVASLQVSSFRRLVDAPYSTTMTTGNLRSATVAAFLALTKKDRRAGMRSMRYFAIIFSFMTGAVVGGLLTAHLGITAIWFAGIILLSAVVLFRIDEIRNKRKVKQQTVIRF